MIKWVLSFIVSPNKKYSILSLLSSHILQHKKCFIRKNYLSPGTRLLCEIFFFLSTAMLIKSHDPGRVALFSVITLATYRR